MKRTLPPGLRENPVARTHAPRLRSRLRLWAVLGALTGAVLTLVVFAPAHWMARALAHATDQRVLLADARGTVWTGSAKLLLTGGQGSRDVAALPQRVQWRWRPSAQGLRLQLTFACCAPAPLQILARPQRNGVRLVVADGLSRWPASLLAGLGSPWNSLQPAGTLALNTRGFTASLQAGQWQFGGAAVLEARDISSALSPLRPMGTYRIDIDGGPEPQIRLETLQGDLRLAGSGQWNGSRITFSGEASAQPGREEVLNNLLNIIGRRNGSKSIITLG